MQINFKTAISLAAFLALLGSAPLYAHDHKDGNDKKDTITYQANLARCYKSDFNRFAGKCVGKKHTLLVPDAMRPSSSAVSNKVAVAALSDSGPFITFIKPSQLDETTRIVTDAPIDLDSSTLVFPNKTDTVPGTVSVPLIYTYEDGVRQDCYTIQNKSNATYFIPLKSDLEWTSFKNAVAANTSLGLKLHECSTPEAKPAVLPPTTGAGPNTFGCTMSDPTCVGGAVGNVYRLLGRYDEALKSSATRGWTNDGAIAADLAIPTNVCSARQYITSVYAEYLNIPNQDFSEVFPGSPIFEGFAIDYYGRIYIEKEGDYRFSLNADDSVVLKIASSTEAGASLDISVIDNGIHGVRDATSRPGQTGTFHLSAGFHDFRLAYAQMPRLSVALQFLWKTPGATEFQPVPLYAPNPDVARPCANLL